VTAAPRHAAGVERDEAGRVRIIAIEEHALPKDLDLPGGMGSAMPGLLDQLDDLGEGRLSVMDAAGVDVQVLSVLGHGIQEAGAAGVELARAANERLAAAVAEHPDRFGAFATLPLGDPTAAAEELRRTVGDAGFVGAMVFGQTHGRFLDDPEFAPVLATCAELGVPLYLHPAPPPPGVAEIYYARLPDGAGPTLATAGWGWHAETGMHVLRLAVAGTFDAHPDLRILVGHMGENLPFSLARADERLSSSTAGERPVMQTVLDQVRITTAGYTTAPPLACALATFGPERILFSVDHPFADSAEATAFLADAPLDEADRQRIAHGNAEALLGV
jgi:predicted TIM-barrel fold metal-dependent hydrolase